MSTLRVNSLQDTAGVERYTARAWVNFNGTGTVAIRAAGNVSSITDNGVGDYTVNFTTAMADTNYSLCGATQSYGSGRYLVVAEAHVSAFKSVSAIRINSAVSGAASQEGFPYDCPSIYVQVFR